MELIEHDLCLFAETSHLQWLIGVDEVGRGALAGPVVAAAVAVRSDWLVRAANDALYAQVKDSKKLKHFHRELISVKVRDAHSVDGGLLYQSGLAEVEEVEELNVLGATCLAMRRAIVGLMNVYSLSDDARVVFEPESGSSAVEPEWFKQQDGIGNRAHILVDGRPMKGLGYAHRAIVGGDNRSFCIALASILAKVERDALMASFGAEGERYAWTANKGYGTARHLEGVRQHGLHQQHRRSFLRKFFQNAGAPVQADLL